MSDWTVEVHLENFSTGATRRIQSDGTESTEMILALVKVKAIFEYEGVRYFSGEPTVDPIARKLTYWCEG